MLFRSPTSGVSALSSIVAKKQFFKDSGVKSCIVNSREAESSNGEELSVIRDRLSVIRGDRILSGLTFAFTIQRVCLDISG